MVQKLKAQESLEAKWLDQELGHGKRKLTTRSTPPSTGVEDQLCHRSGLCQRLIVSTIRILSNTPLLQVNYATWAKDVLWPITFIHDSHHDDDFDIIMQIS